MLAIKWIARGGRVSHCPVCHVGGTKACLLDSSLVMPGETTARCITVLHCAACGARYADPVVEVDYHDIDQHGLRYYVEQGAGIDVMLETFSALDNRPVQRYLEVGCSFGFAMDYARRTLGWEVRGFDPGFVAAAGRQRLDLPIEPRLLDRHAVTQESYDVVFCSEVIEHVAEPDAFVDTLRHALGGNGVLLLTTPDGDAVTPDLPAELLIPVLSPSQHVILYNATAIETLLRRHGFVDVRTRRNATQLQVVAARTPLGEPARYFSRSRYRDFLQSELTAHGDDPLLSAGFGYRLLCEDVNAGAFSAARLTYQQLRDIYRGTYGCDVESPETIAIPPSDGLSLAAFGAHLPYNLCGVWYCRGMIALAGKDFRAAADFFAAAIQVGGVLRAVLQAIGTDDISLANFCHEAEIARLSALARCDHAEGLGAISALRERARGHCTATAETELLRAERRFFTELANLGHYETAATLIADGGPPLDDPADPDTLPVAAAYGVYLLNHRRDAAAAHVLLATVQEAAFAQLALKPADAELFGLVRQIEVPLLTASALVGFDLLNSGSNSAEAHEILSSTRERVITAFTASPDDAGLCSLLQEIEVALLTASAFIGQPAALRLIEIISGNVAGLDGDTFAAHQQRVHDRARALFADLGYEDKTADPRFSG